MQLEPVQNYITTEIMGAYKSNFFNYIVSAYIIICTQFCSSNPGPISIKKIMEKIKDEPEDYIALDDGIIHVILNTYNLVC